MELIDFRHFISAGYFLIQAGNPMWEQLETELLPEKLISLSDCIANKFNVAWGWTTGNKSLALQFGIREALWDEFVIWSQNAYLGDMDIWSMFYSPKAARQITNRFVDVSDNLHLIGVGLPLELEGTNWRELAQDREIYGIEKRIEQRVPMAEGGIPLGFEVASFEYGTFGHSWLCSYLHLEMNKLFGIRPAQYGLMRSEQDARQVYEWIREDEMRGQRAEPAPYDYWLLVEYPLDSQTSVSQE
jgi:hypothetical protein